MQSDAAQQALFYAYKTTPQIQPGAGQTVLFLNAQYHQALDTISDLTLQQNFYPDAMALKASGLEADPAFHFSSDAFDIVLCLLPKNQTETLSFVAQGLRALKKGGVFMCAADNKAGGSRLKKNLQLFGVKDVFEISKHKARCAWFYKDRCDENAVLKCIQDGDVQNILDGQYLSQPGIFGWDKIDQGSKLLAGALPDDLRGHGADFGCGYGYLSRHILENCAEIQSLLCVDADYRAVEACKNNTRNKADYLWADLTQPLERQSLDFIVMNPPFHAGKKTDSDIGAAFIQTAAKALKPAGVLWMVANIQLPYEAVLEKNFSSFQETTKAHGFKIFKAVK